MPVSDFDYRREFLLRLPLPLTQLYSRAYNAKDTRGRHINTLYLWEAAIKLGAATAIGCYAQELRQGAAHASAVDRQLAYLALPSLGQWVGMLRELARHFGHRADIATHPLGPLWEKLHAAHRDLPATLALYQRIKNGPDGQKAGDQSCRLFDLINALVAYRNGVLGHGADRSEAFYEEMGPLLFAAANEVLDEGVLDVVGPRGSRLVYLTELRTLDENRVAVGLQELLGREPERSAPLELATGEAEGLVPNCVAVLWPGRRIPLRLDPLLVLRSSDLPDEILFLNRARTGQAEYLSYTSGKSERDTAMIESLARLLSQIVGREVSESDLIQLSQQSMAETPSVEVLYSPFVPTGHVVGDYEILSELGRGGMGVVYLARQLTLDRLVALKMLPTDLQGDEVALTRFRREVRHLARCEHPNIIKVLSHGTMPDGQLYYSMEYMPGSNLEFIWRELAGAHRAGSSSALGTTTWAKAVHSASQKRREETISRGGKRAASRPSAASVPADAAPSIAAAPTLESLQDDLPPLPRLPNVADDRGGYVRRVVELVRDAARALQVVHDQGIVHRDVKPANLMLSPDSSRIVLMDFGLAKGDTHGLSVSAAGGMLGTLRYAAPEQLAAALLKVGPQADVRALGSTLWELLTRERLFGDANDEAQLTERVNFKDVPRLRSIDPGFDRDLEAIVVRATERRIGDRIQSANELADYLQLYLDHKPLPIRTPGAAELLGRWVREHKPLVGSVAAATLAIVVTVAVAFVEINAAKNVAIEKKDEAEAAHAVAQENLALARKAVDDMLVHVGSTALKDVPQMESVRKALLTKAQDFYTKFDRHARNDPRLGLETARAWRSLGDVYRILEDKKNGNEAYQTAIGHLLRLRLEEPDKVLYQQELAHTYNWLGEHLRTTGQQGAEKQYQIALELQRALVKSDSRNFEHVKELARSLNNLGVVNSDPNEAIKLYDEAIDHYNRAIELVDARLDELRRRPAAPANDDETIKRLIEARTDCRQELAAWCYNNRGASFREMENWESAAQSYATAIDLLENNVKEFPDNREYRRELASTYNNLANLQRKGQADAANTNNDLATKHLEDLAAPIQGIAEELGNSLHTGGAIYLDRGKALTKDGRIEEAQLMITNAKVNFDKARTIFARLTQDNPGKTLNQERLGNACFGLGQIAYDRKDRVGYEEARLLFHEAIEHHQQANLPKHVATDYRMLAWCHAKLLDFPQAIQAIDDHQKSLAAAHSADIGFSAEILEWIDDIERHDLDDAQKAQLTADVETRALELLKIAVQTGFNDASALRKTKQEGGRFYRLHSGMDFQALVDSLTPAP